MSDDPLKLGHLDKVAIEEAAARRNVKGYEGETAQLRAQTAAAKEARIAKGKAPSAPPPPPPPPEVDRSALLDKIGQYRERFPDLKSRNKCSAKSAPEELEDELHYIETQLGSRGSNFGMQALTMSMQAIEHFNPFGLKLQGLTKVTTDNADQFEPIMDELMIKYGATSISMPAEWRLVLLLGTTVYTVHAANSGDPRVAAVLKKMSAQGPSDL